MDNGNAETIGIRCTTCRKFLQVGQFAYDAKGKLVCKCDCGALMHLSLMGIRIG